MKEKSVEAVLKKNIRFDSEMRRRPHMKRRVDLTMPYQLPRGSARVDLSYRDPTFPTEAMRYQKQYMHKSMHGL